MCSPEELSSFPLLAELTPAQLAEVAALARPVEFARGASLILEGRTADRCWLIRSGRVAVQIHQPGGPAALVQTLGPGDELGWSWLVPPYRWRFDAVATEPVTAIELDGAGLRALSEHDTGLGYALAVRLLATLADRLHGTRVRLIDVYRNAR